MNEKETEKNEDQGEQRKSAEDGEASEKINEANEGASFELESIMDKSQLLGGENGEDIASGDYLYYVLKDGTIKITAYKGTATSVTIPKSLDDKTASS